jgi:hypothetical protein
MGNTTLAVSSDFARTANLRNAPKNLLFSSTGEFAELPETAARNLISEKALALAQENQ